MRLTVPGARTLAATLAAVALATTTTAAGVLAVVPRPPSAFAGPAAAAAIAAPVASAEALTAGRATARPPGRGGDPDLAFRRPPTVRATTAVATVAPRNAVHHAPARKLVPKRAPKPKASPTVTRPQATSRPAATYRGTNHMWMPALGIDRSVTYFPCSRSTPPGLAVYRWGCAGANNVYLFAHAYAAFKPLHDAYVSGRLRTGMKVVYADGSGRVHTYAIAWWRLTTPDNGEFAYAAQSRPSLTLQTCVGAQSQYRLIVRLYQVS